VLSERYGIGSGTKGRTFSGNAVWHDAVRALGLGPQLVSWLSAFAAAGLLALVARRQLRRALFFAVTIGTPIAFFTLVPTKGISALFFDRYMLPALPAFLTLVAIAGTALATWAGRARVLVLVLVLAGLMTVE